MGDVAAGVNAVWVDHGPDAGAVWHYGAPLREQRWLEAGQAAVWLPQFAVFSLVKGDLLRVAGFCEWTGLHGARVVCAEEVSAVFFQDDSDGEAFAWGFCEADELARVLAWLAESDMMACDRSSTHELIYRTGFQAVPKHLVNQELGACRAGTWAFDALRIAEGFPRPAFDVFDFSGVFVSDYPDKNTAETSEPLIRLLLDGTDERLPAPGSPVTSQGVVLGRLGSAAIHHELGPIALGTLAPGVSVPSGAEVMVDGVPATIELLT